MKYLPPFDLIRRMVEVSTVRGELRVSLSYDDFIAILRMMISGIVVDEAWYLKEHEDIARAIADGAVASARQHFQDVGYFEGSRSRCRSTSDGILNTIRTSPRAFARALSARRSSISPRMAIARGVCLMSCRRLRQPADMPYGATS